MLIAFVAVVACILGVMSYFRSVAPTVVALAQAKVRSLVTSSINNAVFCVMENGISYDELIVVSKADDGTISFISANSLLINKLANETAKTSELYISAIGEQNITIPLGTLTGTPLFAGLGPRIRIRVEPVGSVICNFISEFEQAGINQTRHKIYLDIVTNVDIIIPTTDTTISTTTQVLITECVLIGKVPETYLNADSNPIDLMDLIP
ncbi:MAG: sporulation protein YunB [Clostridia bacterium]|nr:sporulation protein YunB [Clostridia bacterium]